MCDELDEAVSVLPSQFTFECRFFPAGSIDDTRRTRQLPDEFDFESEEEFEQAMAPFEEAMYSPKPWAPIPQSEFVPLDRYLAQHLTWTLNSRQYPAAQNSRWFSFFNTARTTASRSEYDSEHDSAVAAFVSDTFAVLGQNVIGYETNHLLDVEFCREHFRWDWDCFYDETIACVNDSIIVLLWIGHTRFYG